MTDASQVSRFAARLLRAAGLIELEAGQWESEWADRIASEMVANVPKDTGALASSIQSSAGTVEVGARYGVFVDRGTSRTAPQPFVGPAIDRVKPRALLEARRLALRVID